MSTCATVTVIGTANFALSNVAVDNPNPQPGATVRVTGTLTNTGTATGSATVGLTINGTDQGSSFRQTVSNLGAGAGAAISIAFSAPAYTGSSLTACLVVV